MIKKTDYLVLLVELAVVFSLIKGLVGVLKTKDNLQILRLEKQRLEAENSRLKEQLKRVEKNDYLEYVAREKLNLTKPNETLVIVDKEVLQVEDVKQDGEVKDMKNWQKWRQVVFGF